MTNAQGIDTEPHNFANNLRAAGWEVTETSQGWHASIVRTIDGIPWHCTYLIFHTGEWSYTEKLRLK